MENSDQVDLRPRTCAAGELRVMPTAAGFRHHTIDAVPIGFAARLTK